MEKVILIVLLVASMPASAGYAELIDCRFEYTQDMGRSVYVGTYRSMSNQLYTMFFSSYCPASINL